MSGYSNYSLHQKYTSVQGQILTLNQQVANNTSPTLSSVLGNSNDANNESIQNVTTIDSVTVETETLRIIGTSSNISQISVNATGDLVIDDDQDVIVDIGNKFTVQNKANSNISLDVDTNNNKVSIGGGGINTTGPALQVNGGTLTDAITLTNGTSNNLTITAGTGALADTTISSKTGDLILDSSTGEVVVNNVDFVVKDTVGELLRVTGGATDRVTVPNFTASSITTTGTASTGALTASSISTMGSSTLQSTSTTDLTATELTIGNIQVFNTSGDLTASSITTSGTASTGALTSTSLKNTNNTFSVDATGILSAATVNAGGYQNTNATFSVSGVGALTASSLTSSGSLSFSPVSVADKINLYDSTYSIGIAGGTAFISSVRNIDFVYRVNSSDTSTTAKLRFKVDQTNPQIHSSISDGHIEFFRNANATATKYLTLSSNSLNHTVLSSVGMFALRASNVNTDHVTLTSSALSVNTTTDFVVANGVTEYFKVNKTNNKVDMTDTDVNGALVVTGTANTGALTASSISTTGTASTGALTASSISTTGTANTGALTASSITTPGAASTGALTASSLTSSGLLSFSPVSVADKINLYDTAYSIGVSNGTVFISSAGNVDFVRRVNASDTSTTPLLRFPVTGINPQLISNSTNSSVKDGRFEFARDVTTPSTYATLHSDNNNITVLQTASLFLVRTNNQVVNHFMVNGNGSICNVNSDIDFEVRDGNGFGVATTSYFKVDKGSTSGVGHTNGHVLMVDSEITDGSFHISSSTANTLATSTTTAQGAYMGWNNSSDGATHFLNSSGSGPGGFKFYERNTLNSSDPPNLNAVIGPTSFGVQQQGGLYSRWDENATISFNTRFRPADNNTANNSAFTGVHNYVGNILKVDFFGNFSGLSNEAVCYVDIDARYFSTQVSIRRKKARMMLFPGRWMNASTSNTFFQTTNYRFNGEIEGNNATFFYTTSTAAPLGRPHFPLDLVEAGFFDTYLTFDKGSNHGTANFWFHLEDLQDTPVFTSTAMTFNVKATIESCSELNSHGIHCKLRVT